MINSNGSMKFTFCMANDDEFFVRAEWVPPVKEIIGRDRFMSFIMSRKIDMYGAANADIIIQAKFQAIRDAVNIFVHNCVTLHTNG